MGAELLIRRTIGCFPRPGTGCGLALCHARFPALSVALEGAGTGKILIVRHAVVPQNGRFPTACLVRPRAAKFSWFVAACLHQYCERNDVGFVRRPATRLELRRPELCPLRHATPTKICTAGVHFSSQDRHAGGVTFDGREHDGSFAMLVAPTPPKLFTRRHIVVVQSALVPTVEQHIRAFQQTNQVAMIEIALHRTSSHSLACFDVRQEEVGRYQPGMAR